MLRNIVYRNNIEGEMPMTGPNGRPVPNTPEALEAKIVGGIKEEDVWALYPSGEE